MKCPRRLVWEPLSLTLFLIDPALFKKTNWKEITLQWSNTMALLNTKLLIDVYNKALNSIQYKTIMNTKQDNKMILFTFLFLDL